MSSNLPGCIAFFLALFRRGTAASTESTALPYRLRDDFLSPAERSFLGVVQLVAGDSYVVCPKVNLADVFFVARPNENQAYRNRIDRKHVDFLLCDPATMQPRAGVELDDASHQRRDRRARDVFVDEVFAAAKLPLLRFPVRTSYSAAEVAEQIKTIAAPARPEPAAGIDGMPVCPKCDIPMVQRIATRGAGQGQQFWGCRNFPRCRETVTA